MNAPFNIDTISGDQVDINDEFLDMLKKSVMSSTGVPASYIDASQEVDYARSLAMQNNGFVRNVIRYQGLLGTFWEKVLRRLYELEYMKGLNKQTLKKKKKSNGENIDLNEIHVKFPMPMFMNIQNTNEQISNIQQTIEFIANSYLPDEAQTGENPNPLIPKIKGELKLSLAKDLMQTLDWDHYDLLLQNAKAKVLKEEIEAENDVSNQQNGDQDGDMGGGDDYGGF